MQKVTVGIIITVVGVIVLVLGVLVGWVILPKVIENKIKEQTQLKEGSDIYEKWVNIPVPIQMKFYFFNVTNADELQNGFKDKIPILNDVGPYTFTEVREKLHIRRNEETDTIFFKQKVTYHYDPDNSDGPKDVTILNMPLYTVLTLLTIHLPNLARLVIALFLREEPLFHTVDAVEVAMSGVTAPPGYQPVIFLAKAILGLPIPSEFVGDKFGLWLPRNGTDDGEFEVGTGISDSAQFNVIKSVNGSSMVSEWEGDYCNMINGTDGMMFPPFVKKDTVLYAFGAEICRSIYLTYKEKMEYDGIPGYRFSLPRSAFENPYINEDNMCFCTPVPKPLNDSCNAAGGIRVHTCKRGAPVIISKPHFLDADEQALVGLDGLSPNYNIHDSFIDIEPNTGFPIAAYKRVQASLEVQSLNVFGSPFNNLPHVMFPIAWVSEEGVLTKELADEIKSKLITPLKLAKIGKWTLVGLGCLLIVVGAVIVIVFRKKSKEIV